MDFLRLTKHHIKAVAVALLLALPFVPAMAQTAPSPIPSYASGGVPDWQSIQLCGSGTNGTLAVSSTYAFGTCIGHAATITGLRVGATTAPSVSSSVTIQFFKNSTSNPITGVFDMQSLTSGVTALIPITTPANAVLGNNDIILCQIVTGASLNGCVGATACIQTKAVSYTTFGTSSF